MLLAGCGDGSSPASSDGPSAGEINPNPFPSTYTPYPSTPTLIKDATVLDGIGGELAGGDVLLVDGKVAQVAEEIAAPEGAIVIDAAGKWVTPGIIDNHYHLGVYPSPSVSAHGDGNEVSGAVTAEVWAEHGVWPQDPGFPRALAGGITSLQILPGSANLFGGRGVTLKNVPGRTVQSMKFPDAPYTLKMACGENPKRVYGYGTGRQSGGAPYSRMGNLAGYRMAWAKAVEYKRDWETYAKNGGDTLTRADAQAFGPAVRGQQLILISAHRASDLQLIIELKAENPNLDLVIVGADEGWLVADDLAAANIPVIIDPFSNLPASFAQLGATSRNVERLIAAGVPTAFAHLSSSGHQSRLVLQSAGNAVANGVSFDDAIAAMTVVPAAIFDLQGAGAIARGNKADLVIWDGDPLEVSSAPTAIFIAGEAQSLESRQTKLRDRYLDLDESEKPLAYKR